MIYVHIPFCRSFCTYCDFYSEVAPKCGDSYADALCREIRLRAEEIPGDVNTLYIGGGTPSVLPLAIFERLLDTLKSCGYGGPYEEFTVEVNPEDIVEKGQDYVEGLLRLGVNRISMGIQSFDDGILKFMNRRHSADTARKAYSILEAAGVQNISIDLIFGLPQLSDRRWQETLDMALAISPSGRLPRHISSYQLSVEPSSMLAELVRRGEWEEASEDVCERQYMMLCNTLGKTGYHHYEISNFALPGYEARHNSAYWRHVPYIGFGPGAHSFAASDEAHASLYPTTPQSVAPKVCMGVRQWNEADLRRYIADPAQVQDREMLTDEQIVLEKIMLGLRTSEGIPESFLREHCDSDELSRAFEAGNLVHIDGGRVRIPENRFFVSDSIIADLV